MLRLTGIPISELTHLSEFQRNSEEFKEHLSTFNNTKPTDTSEPITDSESDIAEKDIILLRNVLVLMLDYTRKELPIVESKDIKIYTKLVLSNIKHLFTELDKASNDITSKVTSSEETSIDFNDISDKSYYIYQVNDPEWVDNISIKSLKLVKTDHTNKYSNDPFLDFAKFHAIEKQYPIFSIERKDYVAAMQNYYIDTFNDISASPISTIGKFAEFNMELIPYKFKNININIQLLGRKLTTKLFSISDLYNPVMPNNDTFKHYLLELYFSETPKDDIEYVDKTIVLNTTNIHTMLDSIDILKDWEYD